MATALALGGLAAVPQGAQAQTDQGSVETVVVTGIRASEEKAVAIKRNAANIEDSIVAEDIGKLPDVTISDSLQRITGVQIDRSAGEGSTVEIRGLPQVGTLLNGEVFITADTIDSVQPNFTDIPASLFSGADVYKSSTADMLNTGITGTINLKTHRPFDFDEGTTISANVDGTIGTKSGVLQPETDALFAYNAGRWGILVAGSFSNVTNENSQAGNDQYGGQIAGEDSMSATSWDGILTSWGTSPLPSGVNLLTPSQCPRPAGGTFPSYQASGCAVDVNGNGTGSDAFYATENFDALQELMTRQRSGMDISLQGDLGEGFSLVSDFFYTNQVQRNRQVGYQVLSASWLGATFVALKDRDTGVQVSPNGVADEFYSVQSYRKYLGDMETYSELEYQTDIARNYNLELKYDNGGNFTGEVRALYADAHEEYLQSYLQFTLANADQWNNQPNLPHGTYAFPGSTPTTSTLRAFNPGGSLYNADYVDITTSPSTSVSLDPTYTALAANESDYALKTVSAENDYDRETSNTVLRADGHYTFGESGVKFDFGVRQSNRQADNQGFLFSAPMYGNSTMGDVGAYDQTPVYNSSGAITGYTYAPNSTGCYVHWKAADVTLNGGGIANSCVAGQPTMSGGAVTGFQYYYVANPYAGLKPSELPASISNNVQLYKNIDGTGVSMYDLNPKAMDNVLAFQNGLYPGETRNLNPGQSWHVDLNQTSGYLQGSLNGTLYVPFSLSAGLRIIKTNLTVVQYVPGATEPYGLNAASNGTVTTSRSFTDVLPAINASFDVTDNFKIRAAYAKNMQPLNLSQWGGGLSLNYGINITTGLFPVISGSATGSPSLNPWRSTNYDLSFEYYYGKNNLVDVELFYVEVASFLVNGTVTACNLPDEDGVVRRCVPISEPVQGNGSDLKGAEFDWKQAFDFLPGVLANTGSELNVTYSPSNVGTDLGGGKIPFQDNSELSGNLVLWYQDQALEARVAANYRSKRAVNQDWGGISGLEMYQSPTLYLDAAVNYQITPTWQVYVQGSNLTNQSEHYYLVWKDQAGHNISFESRYTIGVRAKF